MSIARLRVKGHWRAVNDVSMNYNGATTCIGNYAYVCRLTKAETEALDLPIIVENWARLPSYFL